MPKTIFKKSYDLIQEFSEAMGAKNIKSGGKLFDEMFSKFSSEQEAKLERKMGAWLDYPSYEVIERDPNTSYDDEFINKIKRIEIELIDLSIGLTINILPEKEVLDMIPNNTDLNKVASELDKCEAPNLSSLIHKKANKNSL